MNEQNQEYGESQIQLCKLVNKTIAGFGKDGSKKEIDIPLGAFILKGNHVYLIVNKPDDERYNGLITTPLDPLADENTQKKQLNGFLCGLLEYDSGIGVEPSSMHIYNADLVDYILLHVQANVPKRGN